MDTDELQSDLLALRRLYGLLINDKQYAEDASAENLDKNARQFLLNLLNVAADKAFKAHAMMLGTQYITSYNPWSMPQEQSSDGLNPQTIYPSNAPTDSPSLQQVDCLTSESMFSDPMNQTVFPGQTNSEHNVRLKRCRVCQKPTVKQLTKEMSIQERNVLTLNSISQQQNRKRSWEVQNDPSRVEDSELTIEYVKSLTLINLTDEEDQISREASTMILQIDSRISSLKVAVKRVNLVGFDIETQLDQTGSFVVGKSDPTNSRKGRRTWNPANELTLKSQPFDTMSPGTQASQAVTENVGLRNQHNNTPEETSDYLHSGVTTSNANTKQPLFREQMDKKHMDKKEVMSSEIMEWLNPTDRISQSESQQGSTSKNDSEGSLGAVYSGSSSVMYSLSSQDHSPDMSNSTDSSESEPKLRKTVPKKGQKSGIKKELRLSSSSETSGSKSKSWKTVPAKGHKPKSKETVPTKDHKGGNKKEPKSSSSESSGADSHSKGVSLEIVPVTGHKRGTRVSSASHSKPKKTISTKDHKNELNVSSSSESSGSNSRKRISAKNHKSETKKELKIKQVGRLPKLKDKLAIIFHHHYHHHHHHHHPNDEDRPQDPVDKDHHKDPNDKEHHQSDNKHHHKQSLWQKAGNALGHKKRKDEAYGEQTVNKVHSKAIVAHKLEDKKQKGPLKTLVGGAGGLIKHASHAKKSKKAKSGGGKVGKKMQWWDLLQRQRKIKRVEKLRGKIAK